MLRKSILSLLLMPIILVAQTPSPAAVQNPPSAVEALQAILAEIHQLRQDLQATTVTAQRVQILLYRVQLQQGATSRALTRADEIHSKLASAEDARAHNAKDLEAIQECVNTATEPSKVKECQTALAEKKRSVEIWQSDEQQWQAKDAEAQSQLRAEQAKLDQLQDTLDRLDKALAAIAKQ
jgi:chromosome segregation ATPase